MIKKIRNSFPLKFFIGVRERGKKKLSRREMKLEQGGDYLLNNIYMNFF
jgi:hypothetical protein